MAKVSFVLTSLTYVRGILMAKVFKGYNRVNIKIDRLAVNVPRANIRRNIIVSYENLLTVMSHYNCLTTLKIRSNLRPEL